MTLVLVAHGQHPYIYFMVPNHLDPLLASPHPLASGIPHLHAVQYCRCMVPIMVVRVGVRAGGGGGADGQDGAGWSRVE